MCLFSTRACQNATKGLNVKRNKQAAEWVRGLEEDTRWLAICCQVYYSDKQARSERTARAKDVTQRYAMPKLMAIIPNELDKSGGGAVSFYECVIRKPETCQQDVMAQKSDGGWLHSTPALLEFLNLSTQPILIPTKLKTLSSSSWPKERAEPEMRESEREREGRNESACWPD